MRLSGSWPAVSAHPDGWAGVYLQGSTLVSFVNEPGHEEWRTEVGAARFTDCATVGDVIHAVFTREFPGHGDHAYHVVGDEIADLGQCYGMQAVAIEEVGGELVAAMVLPGGTRWRGFYLTSGGHLDHEIGRTNGGTVTGILQIKGLDPIFEVHRTPMAFDDVVMERPYEVGADTYVGQSEDDKHGIIVSRPDDGVRTVITGPGREPKGVRLDDGRYVFCARVGDQACFTVCPPWPDVLKVDEAQAVRVPKLNRAFAFGPWFATSNDASVLAIEPSGHRDHSGNLEIPIRATQEQLNRVQRAMVVAIDAVPDVAGKFLYAGLIHIDADTSNERIREAIPEYRKGAAARGRGLWVYDDRAGYRLDVIRPLLKPGDVAVPCWNPASADEIGPTLRLRLVRELTTLTDAGLTVAPSLCAYSMNGRLTAANLSRLWQLYFDLFVDYPNIFGAVYFALLRKDGASSIALGFLLALFDEFAAGITGLPARPSLSASVANGGPDEALPPPTHSTPTIPPSTTPQPAPLRFFARARSL